MFEYLKQVFAKPTPLELATEELVQAERSKLEAETGREYADALVKYNTARIARLRKYINEETT
jgi:hypothetical protein